MQGCPRFAKISGCGSWVCSFPLTVFVVANFNGTGVQLCAKMHLEDQRLNRLAVIVSASKTPVHVHFYSKGSLSACFEFSRLYVWRSGWVRTGGS